jgi:hypothetical protein
LVVFGEAFRQEISPAQVNIWERFLDNIPARKLEFAFEWAVCVCRFFPTIAEIRTFAAMHVDPLTGEEVEDRVSVIIKANGFPDTPEERERLRPLVRRTG